MTIYSARRKFLVFIVKITKSDGVGVLTPWNLELTLKPGVCKNAVLSLIVEAWSEKIVVKTGSKISICCSDSGGDILTGVLETAEVSFFVR